MQMQEANNLSAPAYDVSLLKATSLDDNKVTNIHVISTRISVN